MAGLDELGPFWDKNGKQLTLRQFGELYENYAYRVVQVDEFPEWEVEIKTMWIGTDQSSGYSSTESRPWVFGTAILDTREGVDDIMLSERFSRTIQEAGDQHQSAVRELSESQLRELRTPR
jgi:hypothetical protein